MTFYSYIDWLNGEHFRTPRVRPSKRKDWCNRLGPWEQVDTRQNRHWASFVSNIFKIDPPGLR